MNGVSVVIPALNEQEALGNVLDQVETALKSAGLTHEIIVVDDGSTDKTSAVARIHHALVIRHPIPGGYGLALRDGILHAKFDAIAIIDADNTYPADRLPELVGYANEFDMVIGQRSGEFLNHFLLKGFIRKIFQCLCEFVTGRKILDVNSGFRVFKKETVLRFKENFCLGFSFTTTITLAFLLNGYFVKYVPIPYYKRAGKSHVRIFKDSLIALQIITQTILYYNPIKLFLLLSLAMGFLSILAFGCFLIWQSPAALMLVQTFLIMTFVYLGMGFMADCLRERKT